jgi:hypothetical protein
MTHEEQNAPQQPNEQHEHPAPERSAEAATEEQAEQQAPAETEPAQTAAPAAAPGGPVAPAEQNNTAPAADVEEALYASGDTAAAAAQAASEPEGSEPYDEASASATSSERATPEEPAAGPQAAETESPDALQAEHAAVSAEVSAAATSQEQHAAEAHAQASESAETEPSPEDPSSIDTGETAPESGENLVAEFEEGDRQQQEIKSEVLRNVLQVDADAFANALEDASLQELVLVMEELAQAEMGRETIRKVGLVKKKFDFRYRQALSETKEVDPDDKEAQVSKAANLRLSNRFSKALATFNKRKAEYEEQLQAEKAQNSEAKRKLLEELKEIVHQEDVQAIKRVRQIQDEWKQIGAVLPQDVEDFFQSYKALIDQFFQLRKQYIELLEQDRKVNLEKKQALIQELRDLVPESIEGTEVEFWQQAVDQVRDLHKRWKQIGPVPKDQSELVWKLFKDATDDFYQKRRAFFEARDREREANLQKKQDIIERLRPYTEFFSESIDDWKRASNEVKGLQDEWKQIGPVPFKKGDDINKTFRELLDTFYDRRREYFRELDEERDEMIQQKQALVKQAQELKDRTDFQETAAKLKNLQEKWRDTGSDEFREARKLQRQFRKACDHFFKRHKAWIAQQKEQEQQNQQTKEDALQQIESQLNEAGKELAEEHIQAIDQQVERFVEAGPVPVKQRDKIENRFNKLLERYLKARFPKDKEAREEHFSDIRVRLLRSRPNSLAKLEREEKKFERKLQEAKEKLQQYENNKQMISPGKKGDALRQEINKRIEEAQQEKEKAETKLEAIKNNIRDLKRAEKQKKQEQKQPEAQQPHQQQAQADAPAQPAEATGSSTEATPPAGQTANTAAGEAQAGAANEATASGEAEPAGAAPTSTAPAADEPAGQAPNGAAGEEQPPASAQEEAVEQRSQGTEA